jgi:hypothetical protein
MRYAKPIAALLLSMAAAPALSTSAAAAVLFTADLTTSQETTPVVPTTSTGAPRPTSFGSASFSLNDAQTALSMSVTFTNIDVTGTQTPDVNDNLTLAHIHAAAPPGVAAGVVWGFFGTPDNDTSPDNLVVTPFATGVGGTMTSVWDQPEGNNTTLTAQLPNLLAGLSYINLHTVQFPAGEIRGQILPVSVPEPSSLALLGASLLLLRLRRRR